MRKRQHRLTRIARLFESLCCRRPVAYRNFQLALLKSRPAQICILARRSSRQDQLLYSGVAQQKQQREQDSD